MTVLSLAAPHDDPELRRLLRENPVPGSVLLSYEREPNFFLATRVEGDRSQTLIARDTDRIVALGTRSTHAAYVNGEVRRIGYLSQLRLDRQQRGQAHLLFRGYEKLRELHEESRDAPFYLTALVDGNSAAERFLTSGHPRLPRYRRLESFRTLILKASSIAPVEGRAARADDLPEVARCLHRNAPRYQFGRAWEELSIDPILIAVSRGRVAGCLALWDQSAFKQVVVRGYAPVLRFLRPALNFFGSHRLPPVGRPLRLAFLSHMAVEEEGVLLELIRAAAGRARERGIDYLVLGLSARNDMLDAVRKAFSPMEYGSTLYLVHWEDSVPGLDSRPCHVEVATL